MIDNAYPVITDICLPLYIWLPITTGNLYDIVIHSVQLNCQTSYYVSVWVMWSCPGFFHFKMSFCNEIPCMLVVSQLFLLLIWSQIVRCPSASLLLIVIVVNFSHFNLLLQYHWANFYQNRHKAYLVKGVKVYSIEEPCLIICVYWLKLFSQVSDVAHGPLVM